jgi:hypothetical protein
MATINTKITPTRYERIGDTQGLLLTVSQSILGQFTSAQNAAVESTFKPLRANMGTLSNTFGGDLSVIDEATGTRFVSNCDGNLLNVNFGRMHCDVVPPTMYRMLIRVDAANGGVWDVIQQVNGGGSVNRRLEGNLSYTVRLDRNDSFRLGFYDFNPANVNVDNDSAVATFTIVKIAQNAPYIIANKGALRSGGAFTFDEDGNCYTENYSTAEVRVGKWITGKPLYKKTVMFTTVYSPADTTVTIGEKSLLSSDIETIVKSEVCELRSDGLTQTVACYITVNGNDLLFRTFTLWGAGYPLYLTAYYTKTTDVPE